MSIHGRDVGRSWTLLNVTANTDDLTITVDDEVQWRQGDQIVIASTSFDQKEAEVRAIESINGKVITLN